MKKIFAAVIFLMCAFMLYGCSAEPDSSTEVYVFSGESDVLSVVNGVIVLDGDEEIFSGGEIKIQQESAFIEPTFWSTEFYVLKDGEKRTVQKSIVNDLSGGASVSLSGDNGKISGENILTEYGNPDAYDFVNNLFFMLTVKDAEGSEKVYEIQMKVEKIY